ncbi:hypothetical protein BGX21_001026 [Mortierella sp. AD011]|nr:hypothetical protein BGX20_007689 [Mortierella sp. AD010]KAF9403653.1 hypothetical protein BGX21_001026 [Mortierella sp. AD011]
MANREGTPDLQEDELELMEEKEKEEAREHRPSLRKVAWIRAMEKLDDSMVIWNKTIEGIHMDDDGLGQSERHELIKAPGGTKAFTADGPARMKTKAIKAELIRESLQQDLLALLTDRVPV